MKKLSMLRKSIFVLHSREIVKSVEVIEGSVYNILALFKLQDNRLASLFSNEPVVQ